MRNILKEKVKQLPDKIKIFDKNGNSLFDQCGNGAFDFNGNNAVDFNGNGNLK